MSRKALGILIIVAGVLVVLAVIGQGRNGTGSIAGDSAGSLLLPVLTDTVNEIDQVSINGAGRQRLVSLERENGAWVVAEAGGYPAARSEVNALLIALAEARIVEEKTANPESHALLGVESIVRADAAGLQIALVSSAGDRFEVVLGDAYGVGQRYARVGLADQSVLIDRSPDISREPGDWVVSDIISVASDRVQRVDISHADGERLEIRKATRDSGNFSVENLPAGRELQYAGVANVTADLLQSLQLDAVERRQSEQTGPSVVSEFWMFDGLIVTVTVTGENENAWLTFSARFDVDQALTFASESNGDEIAGQSREDDAIFEAEAINLRLADWQYRIPSYQLSQLTRRMEDLLLPEADE